jgi:hypothetical protein
MGFLHVSFECCPTAFWWLSALLTPSLIALFPVANAQKSGRS